MQLTYRGQQYSPSQTSIVTPELPIYGTYRGQKIAFKAPQPQAISTHELTYRGVRYTPGNPFKGGLVMRYRTRQQPTLQAN